MYCGNCGKQVDEGAQYCPYCGTRMGNVAFVNGETVENKKVEDDTLLQIAFIFMIITTVISGLLILPLCWMLPMTLALNRCIKEHRKPSIAFSVCTIIFANIVSGILMLVASVTND